MTTQTQIFNFENQTIRTKEINGIPYFLAVDICKALELENPTKALERVEKDDLTLSKVIDKMGREQTANFVNESGLYDLVFLSTKPEAKKFKRWITLEVLPQIRKTGKYEIPQKELSKKELALMIIESEEAKERAEQKAKMLEIENIQKSEIINEQEEIITNYIKHDKDATCSDVARHLGLKPNKFVEKLKGLGYLRKNNEAYSHHVQAGLFVCKFVKPKISETSYPRYYITPKGFNYFFKKMQEGEFDDIKS